MKLLEDVIEELEELDKYRRRAAQLRDQGQKELVNLFPIKNKPSSLKKLRSTGVLAGATVLKSLLVQRRGRIKRIGKKADERIAALTAFLSSELERAPRTVVFSLQRPAELPILRAARAMSTLVTAPDSALSQSVFDFYYVVAREIFTADAPDWMIGGARAGEASAPSAFVTAECTRAITGLHKALANTANYIEKIAAMLEWRERSKAVVPKEWLDIDKKRAALEFLTTAELRKGNIAFKLKQLTGVAELDDFLDHSADDIRENINRSIDSFKLAQDDAENYRGQEEEKKEEEKKKGTTLSKRRHDELQKRFNRSSTAHAIVFGALELAVARGLEAEKALGNGARKPQSSNSRRQRTCSTRRRRKQRRSFIPPRSSSPRARPAARGRRGRSSVGCGEMVFAAVAFGYLSERWDDERLAHAATYLAGALSPRGRFPIGQAIFTNEKGLAMHVLNAELLRAFAQLLQHVTTVEVSPDLARRMLAFSRILNSGTTRAYGTTMTFAFRKRRSRGNGHRGLYARPHQSHAGCADQSAGVRVLYGS